MPRESGLEGQQDLIKGFPEGWGNRDSSLGGHKQHFACIQTQMRKAVTPQETEPILPASVGGPPVKMWVSRRSIQGQGHWKVPLGVSPLGIHH